MKEAKTNLFCKARNQKKMSKSSINEKTESPLGMSEFKSFLPNLNSRCLFEISWQAWARNKLYGCLLCSFFFNRVFIGVLSGISTYRDRSSSAFSPKTVFPHSGSSLYYSFSLCLYAHYWPHSFLQKMKAIKSMKLPYGIYHYFFLPGIIVLSLYSWKHL